MYVCTYISTCVYKCVFVYMFWVYVFWNSKKVFHSKLTARLALKVMKVPEKRRKAPRASWLKIRRIEKPLWDHGTHGHKTLTWHSMKNWLLYFRDPKKNVDYRLHIKLGSRFWATVASQKWKLRAVKKIWKAKKRFRLGLLCEKFL